MRKELYVVASVVAVLCTAGTGHAQQSAPKAVYSCVDANGRRLTADRPIDACLDREQRVTMPGGAVRTVGPTISEKERAEQAAQARREAEERYRANDGKRRERALAVRFPNKAAHEAERADALESLEGQIKIMQQRKLSLMEERKKIDQEMEFYIKDPSKAPPALQSRLKYSREEIKDVDEQIGSIGDEIKRTNKRFDDEAAMLKQYWTPVSASK